MEDYLEISVDKNEFDDQETRKVQTTRKVSFLHGCRNQGNGNLLGYRNSAVFNGTGIRRIFRRIFFVLSD